MPRITDDQALRDLLRKARTIAVVGMSNREDRVSNEIGRLLARWGYTVYPVNPTVKGDIDGLRVYPTLADVPEAVDIVNVFRRSEYLEGVVDEAIAIGAKAVWAQLGIFDADAARKADDAGLPLVMNRCIKVDYRRLLG